MQDPLVQPSKNPKATRVAVKIVAVFTVVGIFWVLYSHEILAFMIADGAAVDRLLALEIEEWIPLFVSAFALYFLIRHNLKVVEREKDFIASLIESAPTFIVAIDAKGKTMMMNRAMLRALGYSSCEVLGSDYLAKFVPESDRAALSAVWARLAGSEKILMNENRVLAKDGKELVTQWHGRPILDADGRLEYLLGIGINITDQKRLEQEVLNVSEREQRRIGRDLHDGLGQTLTAAAYKAKLIEEQILDNVLPEPEEARKIVKLMGESIGQARSLARGLYPMELAEHGLVAALQEFASSVTDGAMSCTAESNGAIALDDDTAVQLYRIAQEAVSNAIRHANPKHIAIALSRTGEGVLLSVKDDGAGLHEGLPEAGGMGLHIMRYRAGLIGGKLRIESGRGRGTSVSCLLENPRDPVRP